MVAWPIVGVFDPHSPLADEGAKRVDEDLRRYVPTGAKPVIVTQHAQHVFFLLR
jgi:hypothetical protein